MVALLHLLLAGAALAAPANPPAKAATYSLVVEGGSGGGQFPAQTVAQVWADLKTESSVFDSWSGDTGRLVDKKSAHTQIVMPAATTRLKAVFREMPAWSPSSEEIHGGKVAYFVPESHHGLVLVFSLYETEPLALFRQIESRLLLRDLVAAGYAVAVLRGEDPARKTWEYKPRAGNPDIRHVREVIASLSQRGLIQTNEPLFAIGIGLGGNFVTRLAYVLPLKAVAVFLGNGSAPRDSHTPTIWLMAQNDERTKIAASGDPLALDNYGALSKRGVRAQYNINDPSPVYPLRFARIPGITPADSNVIYQALKDQGQLDGKGYLRQSPTTSNWGDAIPVRFGSHLPEIREQLEVCYTDRRFFSDFDHRVIDFFSKAP